MTPCWLKRRSTTLNWASALSATFFSAQASHIKVETNDHNCDFGKWLYGEERKKIEDFLPDLAPLLQAIEEPHRLLHASALAIGETLVDTNSSREQQLAAAKSVYAGQTLPALKQVQQLLGSLREEAGVLSVNNVILNKSLPEETVNIAGDQERLKDVFKNLLVNGIEAMNDRPEKVMNIDLVISDKQNKALLSFTDNGCGIPTDRIEEIFKPYITSKNHGTGLGLAIVKEILAEHGGTIKVTSTPGHGTCFLLTLPLSTT